MQWYYLFTDKKVSLYLFRDDEFFVCWHNAVINKEHTKKKHILSTTSNSSDHRILVILLKYCLYWDNNGIIEKELNVEDEKTFS